jgi:misacylated tRNA(Ala) deacylase
MTHSTRKLFIEDSYLSATEASVVEINERGGVILDQTIFYATSGGQPGDSGWLERSDGSKIEIATTVCGNSKDEIIHVLAEGQALPDKGEKLTLHIDWERRYNFMRMHTACHLLTVILPYPITGCQVGDTESRLDFDIEDQVDKFAITEELMKLVEANHPVFDQWISDEDLAANPDLVKSKHVKPPQGTGRVRLICIGENSAIDTQPCGGTHVSETQEIGAIHIGKMEKKGKNNRRLRLRFGEMPQQ